MKTIKKLLLFMVVAVGTAQAADPGKAPKMSKQEEAELARALRASRYEFARQNAPRTPAQAPKPAVKPSVPKQQLSDLERAMEESKREAQLQRDIENARRASLLEQEQKEGESEIPIRVRLVKAPQQINSECGYHAARNTAIRLSELSGKKFEGLTIQQLKDIIEPKRIKEAQRLSELEQKKGHTYQAMLLVSKKRDAQLLDSQEVECVAGLLDLRGQDYSIIPDIHTVNKEHLTDKALEAFKKLQTQEGYCHSFMIGNMSQAVVGGEALGTVGHWISIVACRENGIIECEVRDSLNGNPQGMINAFKKLLTIDTTIVEIDFMVEQALTAITENIENGREYAAMAKIRSILNQLQMLGYVRHPHFKAKYEQQIRTFLQELALRGFDTAGTLDLFNEK